MSSYSLDRFLEAAKNTAEQATKTLKELETYLRIKNNQR